MHTTARASMSLPHLLHFLVAVSSATDVRCLMQSYIPLSSQSFPIPRTQDRTGTYPIAHPDTEKDINTTYYCPPDPDCNCSEGVVI